MHGLLKTGDLFEMSVATLNMTKGTKPPTLSATFESFPATTLNLAAPTMPKALPKVVQGTNADPKRNFVWLPYHPGYLTLVPFGNLPVFTGWMSGCWIALVTVGAQNYVLHVGTETSATSKATIDVKNEIKIAIGTKSVVMHKAWMPSSGTGQTLACVSPDTKFHDYAVQTTPNPAGGPMGLKVVSITTRPFQPGLPQGY